MELILAFPFNFILILIYYVKMCRVRLTWWHWRREQMMFTHDGRQKPVHDRIRLHNTHPPFVACVSKWTCSHEYPCLKIKHLIIASYMSKTCLIGPFLLENLIRPFLLEISSQGRPGVPNSKPITSVEPVDQHK